MSDTAQNDTQKTLDDKPDNTLASKPNNQSAESLDSHSNSNSTLDSNINEAADTHTADANKALNMRVGDIPNVDFNDSASTHLPENSLQNTASIRQKPNNSGMGQNLMMLACFVGMGVFAAYWFTLANLQKSDNANKTSPNTASSINSETNTNGNATPKTIPAIMVKSTKGMQTDTNQVEQDKLDTQDNEREQANIEDGIIVPNTNTTQADNLPDANQSDDPSNMANASTHFVAVAEPKSSTHTNTLTNQPTSNSLPNRQFGKQTTPLNRNFQYHTQNHTQSNHLNSSQGRYQQAFVPTNQPSQSTKTTVNPADKPASSASEDAEVMSDAQLAALENTQTAQNPTNTQTTIKDEQHLTGKDDTGLLDMDLPAGQKEFDATQFEVNDTSVKQLQQQSQNTRNEAEVLHEQISQSITTIKEHNQTKIQQEQAKAKQAYHHKKQSDIQKLEAQLESSTLDNLETKSNTGKVEQGDNLNRANNVKNISNVNNTSNANNISSVDDLDEKTQALDKQPVLVKQKKESPNKTQLDKPKLNQTKLDKNKPEDAKAEKITTDSSDAK